MGELVLVVLGGAGGSLQVSFQGLQELANAQSLLAISSPAHVCRRKRSHYAYHRKLAAFKGNLYTSRSSKGDFCRCDVRYDVGG